MMRAENDTKFISRGASVILVGGILCCFVSWECSRAEKQQTIDVEKVSPLKRSWLSLLETENSIAHGVLSSLSSPEQQEISKIVLYDHKKPMLTNDCSKVSLYEQVNEKLKNLERANKADNTTLANRMSSLQNYEHTAKLKWESDQHEVEKATIQLYAQENALKYASLRLVPHATYCRLAASDFVPSIHQLCSYQGFSRAS